MESNLVSIGKLYVKRWDVKILNEKILYQYKSKWLNFKGLCLSGKCCKILKEDVLKKNKANIVGLRISEKGRHSIGINKNNPNIYNYLDRTGCVMCGFGTKKI